MTHLCFSAKNITFWQGWEFSHRFPERIARFLPKNERMTIPSKKNKRFAHSLIFGERPEPKRSFLVSDLSDSLIFSERPERFTHICSFIMSDLRELLTVALLTWATCAICHTVTHSFFSSFFIFTAHQGPLQNLVQRLGFGAALSTRILAHQGSRAW